MGGARVVSDCSKGRGDSVGKGADCYLTPNCSRNKRAQREGWCPTTRTLRLSHYRLVLYTANACSILQATRSGKRYTRLSRLVSGLGYLQYVCVGRFD